MGFHGYGHSSCLLGDCPLVDCSFGPERHYHGHSNAIFSQESEYLRPDRTAIPGHPSRGPVDLSRTHVLTSRGTWSIGGQQSLPQPLPTAQPQAQVASVPQMLPVQYNADSRALTENAAPAKLNQNSGLKVAIAGESTKTDVEQQLSKIHGLGGAGDNTKLSGGTGPGISRSCTKISSPAFSEYVSSETSERELESNQTTPDSDYELQKVVKKQE